jgi:dolichol-phosphate mannosyltransferase
MTGDRSRRSGPAVVVIPTYNEAANVGNVLDRILRLAPNISVIIVDDGSPDGTASVVEAKSDQYPGRVHLIERSSKSGLGTAYLAGFRRALEEGFELICEMDADLSHNPDDLPRLMVPIRNGEADLVVGSRYIGGVRVMNWPLGRLFLSYGACLYTRLITRIPVIDATAGFKCYHRSVLESIDLTRVHSNGYSFQIEMKYRAWKKGFRLREVPIVFTERSEGNSKMNRAIVREAALKVWELRLRDLVGRL